MNIVYNRKNRSITPTIFGLLLFLMFFFITGCTDSLNKVVSIEIVQYGKTEYNIGEVIDFKDYKLNVLYSDEKNETVEITKSMCDKYELNESGTITVFVNYPNTNLKVSFDVVVSDKKPIAITIKETGVTSYTCDSELDLTGYVFEVEYSDNSKKDVTITKENVDITAFSNTDVVKEQTINVSYSENNTTVTTSFKITIMQNESSNNEVTGIIVKQLGQTKYSNGVDLDLTGFIFELSYKDNTKKEITITKENVDKSTFSLEEVGTQVKINVSYTENNKTVNTSFDVDVLDEYDYYDYNMTIKENKEIDEIIAACVKSIPSEITEDVSFIESEDYNYSYIIVWTTSNTITISPLGLVNRAEEDEEIELFVKVKGSYITREHSWKVKVIGLGPIIFPEIKENQKLVFAYFYEGTYQDLKPSDATRINVLNYCFGTIINGKLSINGLNNIKKVLQLRRDYGIRVVLSIGGGGVEGFSGACETTAKRKVFVDSIMEVVKTYHFDGVDLDWEYPGWSGLPDSTPNDTENFTYLCKELREQFDLYKEGLILSAALISSSTRFYQIKEINKYLDYAHIMTYDGNNTGIASHHTRPLGLNAYSAEAAINLFKNAGIDAKKIVIGAAFYGKISELSNPTTPYDTIVGKPVLSTKTIRYTDIYNNYLTNSSFVERYDQAAGAYYLTDGKWFITYDNKESIEIKCSLIKDNNLGGMMFWDYGSDNTGRLLTAVYNGINKLNEGE